MIGNGLHSRSITLHRYGIRSKGFIDATVRDEPHARTDIGCRAITRHPKLVMGGLRACIAIMSSSNVIVLSGFKNGSYVPIAVARPPIELLVDGCFPGYEGITTLVLSRALFGAMKEMSQGKSFSHTAEKSRERGHSGASVSLFT